MSNIKKRLISALCTFVVGASSDLVALPQFNCSAYTGLFSGSNSSGSSDRGKKRRFGAKPDSPVVSAFRRFGPWATAAVTTAFAGDTIAFKGGEYVCKRYLVTGICWLRSPVYRVLYKKFNLLQKANEAVEVGNKVSHIGCGLVKIKDYFFDEKAGKVKDEINVLDDLKFDEDVAAALCHLLAIGYSSGSSKSLRDDDVLCRTFELFKRVVIPLSTPRENFCFEIDENAKEYKYVKKSVENLKNSDDIRCFILASDARWKVEGRFHGYGVCVSYPFNVELVKYFFAKSLSVDAAVMNNEPKQSVRAFLDRFDDTKNKDVKIEDGDAKSCTCFLSGGVLYLSVKAKIGNDKGILKFQYNVPDGKGNVDITKLFNVKFIKNP